MSDEPRTRAQAPLPDEARESFRRTTFVLGPFPVVSQTFIYRELDAMRNLGLDVQVISTGLRQPEDDRFTHTLREVQRTAIYLDYRSVREIASIGACLVSPSVLSTMRWKKGVAHLLDAAGILKREGRHFEVRFIGDGPDRAALESQVNRLGIRNEVRFLGVRPNAEVFDQIDAARVVAVPSVVTDEGDMDGLPNVVLEALGMSRPVVFDVKKNVRTVIDTITHNARAAQARVS